MPHLRTPASRAHQHGALLQAARSIDPNGMDLACARGAPMDRTAVETLVQASTRGHFHPLRMLECIRCVVRWNGDLVVASRGNDTSAAITLLQSVSANQGAFAQAVHLVERRLRGARVRVRGEPMRLVDALAVIGPGKSAAPDNAVPEAPVGLASEAASSRSPKP